MHDCVCPPGGAGGTPSQDMTHYYTHVSLEVGCADSNVSAFSAESGLPARGSHDCHMPVTHPLVGENPQILESSFEGNVVACLTLAIQRREPAGASRVPGGSRELPDPPDSTPVIARNGGLSRMIA